MSSLVKKLEVVDEYFEKKSESEKIMLIVMIAGVVGFLAYLSFFDYAKRLHDQSILQQKTLTKKIHDEEVYLRTISKNGDQNYRSKKYDKEIAEKKVTLKAYNKKISIINKNLDKLSDMLFNQKSWSIFLNSITNQAANNQVDIEKIINKYVDNNGSFGHVLEIGLQCKGEFKNIVKFINDLEQNTLVTDVYQSKIYSEANESGVFSDIHISVWGVNH